MNTVSSIWRKRAAQPVLGVFLGLVLVLQTAAPTATVFAQEVPQNDPVVTEEQAPAPDEQPAPQEDQNVPPSDDEGQVLGDENKDQGEQEGFASRFLPKIEVCHKTGNSYKLKEIFEFQWELPLFGHKWHGDIYPVPQNGCPSDEETGNLTLIKEVVGGQESADSWTLYADGEGEDSDLSGTTPVSGEVEAGNYALSESGPDGYTASDWVCVIASDDDDEEDEDDNKKPSVISAPMEGNVVTVGEDQDITCTITNTFIEEVPNDLVLESICSDDPETIRAWKITNSSDSEIEFNWSLNNGDQDGTGTAPANGSTTIITNTQGENTLEITWYEDDTKQDASLESTGLLCPKDDQPCGTELVSNGSFEVPAIGQSWDIVNNNTPGLGWFVQWMPGVIDGPAPIPASVELHRGVNGWAPQEGQQHAELDGDWGGPSSGQSGEDGSTKIYQHLPTVAGHEYTISFWTSPRPGIADNQVRFSWDGTVEDTIVENGSANGQTVWTQHTYTLTATGPMTTIEFADLSVGDSLGSFIDNVSVVEECADPCELKGEEDNNPTILSAIIDKLTEIALPPQDDDEECVSTISGMKFNDLNGNGLKDEGETGLAGWDIYAYNGIPSSNITVDSSNITGSDTNWVAPGEYVVMARGTWNNGGSQYFDTEFHTANSWSSHEDGVVPYGTDIGDIVINDTQFVDWGVYNDQNENGFEHYYFYILNHPGGNINYSVFDGTGGVKNAGWYGDNTGSINVQMYKLLDTAVTDANGNYTLSFNTDEAVTAVVREFQQNGWVQTSPNASTGVYALNGLIEGVNYPITGNWNYIFEAGDRDVTGADFGNHFVGEEEEDVCERIVYETRDLKVVSTDEIIIGDQYVNCSISGYKYSDIDGDGNVDEGDDEGLEGWRIYIDENGDNEYTEGEPYDYTDSNGHYSFYNLAAGSYTIREENQSGWNTIFPSTSNDSNEYVINLVLESFNGTDFHNQPEDKPCEEVSEEVSLFSNSNTDTAGYTTGPLTNDTEGLDATNYSGGGSFTSAVELVAHPAWIDPTTNGTFSGSGAVWISTNVTHPGAEGGEGEGNENQWRLYQTKFNVPADATVTPGTLYFSADNAVSVYLNGTLIDDTSEDLVTYGPNSPIPEVFKNVYSVALNPVAGQENVLEFVVRNSAIGQVENPTGLLYKGDFSYVVDCDDDGGDGGDGDGDGDGGGSRSSGSSSTGRVLGDSTGLPYEAPGRILGATTLPRTGNSVELYTLLAFMAVLMATPLLSRKAAK